MGMMKMGQGEVIRADMTTPFRALIFPFLELILVTGLAWIAIGWCDTQGVDLALRNALVGVWAILAAWRFGVPLFKARRRRFIVTNQRVIARQGKKVDSIPLRDISGARRRRGGISLVIHGFERPLYFSDVPKAKKVEALLNEKPWY